MWANLRGVSRFVVVFILSLSSVNCGRSNAIETFATTTDNASLYQTVMTALNKSQFDKAITACGDMSAAYLAGDGRFVCASAYAGRCGYKLTDLVTIVSGYDPTASSTKLLKFLMQQYHGATASQSDDCETAAQMLRTTAAASRTDDENFMMILMSLTHLGKMMNALADTDDDDTADAAFDQCNTSKISLARVNETGRAFWDMYRSAVAINNSLFTNFVTAFDSLSTAIDSVNTNYNFLKAAADPTAYTASQIQMIRAFIGENSAVGLGLTVCGPGNLAACLAYVQSTCP